MDAVFGRNARTAVSIFARRLSESQGRMRTNRSTTLLDTNPARPCCVIATSAAELTAGSGEKAKPKAASRTASLSDPAERTGHRGVVLRRKRRSRACQFCVDRERIVVERGG